MHLHFRISTYEYVHVHVHVHVQTQMYEKLNREREHVSDVVRQEFADRLVATDDENRRLKNELSELKARHRSDMQQQQLQIEQLQSQQVCVCRL